MSGKSKHGVLRFLIFSVVLASICAGVSFFTAHWVMQGKEWKHDEPHHGHAWLHEELGLTADEAARIDVFEGGYRAQRAELQAEFNKRIENLAKIIRDNDSFSEEVTHAVHELHEVHGDLQNLAISHYYEMLSVLPSDKQEKLKALAVEALSQPE
jgi:hypothetical protein